MATPEVQVVHLRAAIAAQEALRSTLGNDVVEATLAALRARLSVLTGRGDPSVGIAERDLARLQSHVPRGLASRMEATGRIEGEHKPVTVLFADIAGYTTLGEHLDPETLASCTDAVLRELAEAVLQYDGHIDKFLGDGVMAVFGAPVTHEDDAERALWAALNMRERVAQINRIWVGRLGRPLALHIGVNTGLVVAGTTGSDSRLAYTVIGDTVNTASRLESAALPGQILVSQETHRLAEQAFTFMPLEPITVKGKREPVSIFELRRAKLHPGKSRGVRDLAPVFVGREIQLSQLRRVMEELEGGYGRIVAVTGDAGIGKSRLMSEWRTQLGERVRWLEGRSFAHTTGLSYGPFLDIFRRYAGIADDDSESTARARLHAAVERLFPGNREAHAIFANLLAMRLTDDEAALLAELPSEALRQQLFTLIRDLFARLAADRATWIVLEDMHWADPSSLELVEHLLPLVESAPLAIVGVFRQQPDAPPSALQRVSEGGLPGRFTGIMLEPLPQDSSREMIVRLLETSDLPPTLIETLINKTEGNPFFLEEMLRALIERGALVRATDSLRWIATPVIESVAVPDTVQGLLLARLDRLPDEARWVVQQAAVIGRIFLYRILAHMVVDTPGMEDDLRQLEREALIRERARDPEIEYMFRHALTQEVAYQSLLSPRRKELHLRVGAAMEAIFAERLAEYQSIVAEHFLRAEAWAEATVYLLRAGDASARLYAHAEARLHFGKALDALRSLPDTEENRRRRVDTAVKYSAVSFVAERPERNLERLAEAEGIARTLPDPDGGTGGDRLRLARVHFEIGRIHYYGNNLHEAAVYFRQVLAVAQEFGDEQLLAIPASLIGRALGARGMFGQALPLVLQAREPLAKVGNWKEWMWATIWSANCLSATGRYDEAVAHADEAVSRGLELNYQTGIAASHIGRGWVAFMGGDFDRMLEEMCLVCTTAEQAGDNLYVYVGWGYRALAESRLGRHKQAFESMERSLAVAGTLGGRLLFAEVFAAVNADIVLAGGLVEDALRQAEAAVETAAAAGNAFAEGVAQRVWGQALVRAGGASADIEAHFAASVRSFEAGEARLEAARTHVAWGSCCAERDDELAARAHIERAAEQFIASGLTSELARLRVADPSV